jgi:alkanesulfonate monooxygenase SsuD/methylene tetrahydromethanopterin reductase-like flavin-dependent oxidoreductase (luciferase family)
MAKPRPESLTLLGALAGVTKKVTLGVGCMASFPVRDPIVFAYQWATLDMISNGRMLLAACTGIVKPDASNREGAPWGVTDKERASRMAENIEICRQLWTGETVDFSGEFYSFTDVSISPTPVQNPCPIWIAANPSSPKYVDIAMKRVATSADGWMTVQLFPGALAMTWGKLSEYLNEAERDPATFPNIVYHNYNINADKETALEESKRFLDSYYGPVFTPEMVATWTAAGSPQECIQQLRDLRDAGAKQVTLRATTWDQKGQYERLVNDILPYVNN